MATSLRCLHHTQRLLQSIIVESHKQSISHSNFPVLLKACRSLCTKLASDEEMGAVHLDKEPENHFDRCTRNVSDESDTFGRMKIPLEIQMRMKKNNDVKPDFKVPRETRRSRKSQPQYEGYKIGQPQNEPNESDTFGKLTDDSKWYAETAEPEPDDTSTIVLPETKYRSPQAYLKEMTQLVKQKKLKEALELFPDMKRNNVFPYNVHYTFMIGACGRAGYTEMAFKLLKEMTARRLTPTSATLTGLFNSCAECPFPEYGLQQIAFLREKIAERHWPLSQPTYHALIKAYGRCGDILASFQVVDEMIAEGVKIDSTTYQFLLMSCISDKEAGFTHAVEVWRKLIAKKLVPTIFFFNLLLRATRDCGVGPERTSSLLLQHWSSFTNRPYGLSRRQITTQNDMLRLANPQLSMIGDGGVTSRKFIEDTTAQDNVKSMPSNVELSAADELGSSTAEMPVEEQTPKIIANLLVPRPHGPQFVDLLKIETASDRLALLGCAEGFLQTMHKYKVIPNIKTFMLLLESLPPSTEWENDLISLMDENKVKPDVDFFNILTKRRNLRRDYGSARRVLMMINRYNLTPDIATFGVLSLGCHKRQFGQQLLREMKQIGCHPNVEIMGGLIHNAAQSNDFEYLMDILEAMKYQKVKPNDRILSKLETTVEAARKIIIDMEQGKDVPHFFSERYRDQFYVFFDYYTEWLKRMEMQVEEHPWDQYKAKIHTKDRNLRFLV